MLAQLLAVLPALLLPLPAAHHPSRARFQCARIDACVLSADADPVAAVPLRRRIGWRGRIKGLWSRRGAPPDRRRACPPPSLHLALRHSPFRCDDQVCRIRSIEPLAWVRSLLPKKRPLNKLSFCEGGTFKVRKVEGGKREMIMVVAEDQPDSCSVESAMDMF